ncbi:NUDIX hydrolase [Micromonospora polyrhachis]|uniref:8-oxo-dGTP diphosphatase n=1 Tax=Micromonospora polyrhachis TaxID=1282883 RepID=A0A7W7WMW9_9ACTN|nr:bifunctional NUDIX hydrolase/histidine phosphatase family protein [Micromonospora polyrhachis]MBB4957571.1 8-oxo-dGTP diphosphatase [Micromonospora polyrhachis]
MARGRWRATVAERPVIRAAGGVAWRPGDDGCVEVCLVHRPRYDDWSLPKGKLDPGEPALLAAVREIAEEADVQAVPQVRLATSRYVSNGHPKIVEYWSMRAVGAGGFQPDTEVDQLRWLPVAKAIELVSYPHDATVLRSFAELPPVSVTLILVRHAAAGSRDTWSGPDTARPLDDTGRAQAHELARLVPLIRPVRLLSASTRRCVQTFDPTADRLDLSIEVDGAFDEPTPGWGSEECGIAAADRLVELAIAGKPVAVCSQGRVIPDALERLTSAPGDFATPQGTGWLLAFAGDRLLAADHL